MSPLKGIFQSFDSLQGKSQYLQGLFAVGWKHFEVLFRLANGRCSEIEWRVHALSRGMDCGFLGDGALREIFLGLGVTNRLRLTSYQPPIHKKIRGWSPTPSTRQKAQTVNSPSSSSAPPRYFLVRCARLRTYWASAPLPRAPPCPLRAWCPAPHPHIWSR